MTAGLLGGTCKVQASISIATDTSAARAYICGEETRCSMLKARRASRVQNRRSRPLRLYASPPLTTPRHWASVPAILAAMVGSGSESSQAKYGGVNCFGVGPRQQTGQFEIPMGTPSVSLLARPAACAAVTNSRRSFPAVLHAVLPAPNHQELRLGLRFVDQCRPPRWDRGAVIVMDDSTCTGQATANVCPLYYAESAGQCTPCREGHRRICTDAARIETGKAGRKI